MNGHHHNGNQARVLAAVRAGYATTDHLMRATGLDYWAVANALRRLRDKGLIARRGSGSRQPIKLAAACALGEQWK